MAGRLPFLNRHRLVSVGVVLALVLLANLAFFDVKGQRTKAVQKLKTLVGPKVHRARVDENEGVAFCAAVRDQAADMVEWFVHHYHHHNVTRFYIQDDGSDPPLSTFQYPGVPREALTFVYITPSERAKIKGTVQQGIYERCAAQFGARHSWMAFFDVDEFLEVKNPEETLQGILAELEQPHIGAVGVNWKIHTNSGQLHRAESTRHTYDTCISDIGFTDNGLLKSIVRMEYFSHAENPHVFYTLPGPAGPTYTVGDDGKQFEEGETPPYYRVNLVDLTMFEKMRMRLHHYAIKSRDEYEAKMNRWQGELPKNDAWYKHIEEEMEHVHCPELMSYQP